MHANGNEERQRRGRQPGGGSDGGNGGGGGGSEGAASEPAGLVTASARRKASKQPKNDGGSAATAPTISGAPAQASATEATAACEELKWGAACLAVLPDSWIEEEADRRKSIRKRKAEGEGSSGSPQPEIMLPPQGQVQLCNTGKCEMFD